MLNFGTSAFLKLVCLNDRPQRTEIRKRLLSTGGGYDYHRSFKLRAQRYLLGGESMTSVTASIQEISKTSEQNSVRTGLSRLEAWRFEHGGELLSFPNAHYESPEGLFKVSFVPDVGVRINGSGVAVHIWNTMRPPLLEEMAHAVLAMFAPQYEELSSPLDDLAVLDLPASFFYRLSEAAVYEERAIDLAHRIEAVVREVADELDLPDDDFPAGPTP